MQTFVTKTGAPVIINPAAWPEAKRLKKAIQQELAGSTDVLRGFDASTDISVLGGLIMRVDGSDAVDAALWPCLARCTRNGDKITEQTFEDPAARKDYYEIVVACAKENLGPLVESLLSVLPANILTPMKQAEKPPQ